MPPIQSRGEGKEWGEDFGGAGIVLKPRRRGPWEGLSLPTVAHTHTLSSRPPPVDL